MKEKILGYIKSQAIKWYKSLYRKIKKDPRLIIVLLVALYCAYYMGKVLYDEFGILTLLGYATTIFWRITKVADKPERTMAWGVGFWLGAMVVRLIPEMLFPAMKGWDIVSIISVLIICGVLLDLYLKSRELKNS